ncbi:plasmid stability/partitioning protein [Providencia rettgeri]
MIIVYGSHKGGVGKTTLVLNHAVLLKQKGLSVVILRADKNEDAEYWALLRSKKDLPLITMIEQYGNLTKKIEELDKVVDVVIVDVAGHSSIELNSALSVADLCLSPICPSAANEIFTLKKFSADVKAIQTKNPKLKAYTLLTRCETSSWNNDASKTAQFLESSEEYLSPLKSRISQLSAYRKSLNEGIGVHEMNSKANNAKAQLEIMMNEIIQLYK